jgi:hypothetical protein
MCIVPKFSLIDSWCWFHLFLNYLYPVTLLNLKVSYAFMFCYSMRDKLKAICYVFHMIWTHVWLSLSQSSLIDSYCWFHLFSNYLYLVALLNLKVSYTFMFCSLWRTSWKPFVYFSLWFEHMFDFHCFIFMISCLGSFACYNMVAKSLLSRLYLSCPCFKFLWSQLTMLTYMIKIV